MGLLLYLLLALIAICHGSGPAAGGAEEALVPATDSSSAETESTKILKPDRAFMLTCKITLPSNGAPSMSWFKDDVKLGSEDEHYTIFPDNATLYFPKAVEDDVGLYRCQQASTSFNISVITIKYKKMPKSVTVLQAEQLKLVCDVEGNPTPSVTWTKDGVNVLESMNQSRFDLVANEADVPNATFLVTEASYDDRGTYACQISSEGISFDTTSFVRVKDMYAALWPFLGICAEVVVLCIIIFIYEKRRMKIEYEESDNDQPETKGSTGQNKDVRQRK